MKTQSPTGKEAAPSAATATRNEQLAARLFALQTRLSLSDDKLGRKLGYQATYVSRYRGYAEGKWQGNLQNFEDAIANFLLKEELMQGDDMQLAEEGFCVKSVFEYLDFIHQNRHIGVGYGPAGKGKTCAAKLYASKNPTCVYLHIWDWTTGRDKLISELCTIARVRCAKGESKAEALVRTFRDSDRLIIIDNAQRLTSRSRKFIMDFFDATRTPIALFGNPEIVRLFEANDQHASRLGRCIDVTDAGGEARSDVDKASVLTLLKAYMPEAANDKGAQSQALEILRAKDGGASRAVKMTLKLAERISKTATSISATDAIRLAKTQLIHQEAA
ncbi:AAA family ATPase [Prosthecobacter vanneervenii]|uniref:DNA transposition AAA+ family ATPase n=1 Tax=Prosthecobacter vanneervenii TaxID=48466 RepID=A0A7W8DKH5_9BACT|nr:AAA family ATPase [Prosthecobacter vanneervenii]MBB5033137.1 DNA transposition AAA+ family ATPase [Prosthecobacter vanneervenii]